jgi:rhodanese-related sulfurtransferase
LLQYLGILTCVLTCSLFGAESGPVAKAYQNTGVEDFDKLRADKANVVLDVRTPREFAAGHIPGAINVDWNGKDFAGRVAALDKKKNYLVYCAVGGRSARASAKMIELGFSKVYNLERGISSWQQAGKPTEP